MTWLFEFRHDMLVDIWRGLFKCSFGDILFRCDVLTKCII